MTGLMRIYVPCIGPCTVFSQMFRAVSWSTPLRKLEKYILFGCFIKRYTFFGQKIMLNGKESKNVWSYLLIKFIIFHEGVTTMYCMKQTRTSEYNRTYSVWDSAYLYIKDYQTLTGTVAPTSECISWDPHHLTSGQEQCRTCFWTKNLIIEYSSD